MATLKIENAVDAVTGMQALHDVLLNELSHIEDCIQELDAAKPAVAGSSDDHDTHLRARAALYGGIASINDVLGWVRLMTERDLNGDEFRALWPLPNVPVSAMN